MPTSPGNTSYFDSVNRNKRSIGVDLATPEGLAIVKALARESDVLVQNFKTGGAEKLGLGYAALSAENSGLIYCSIAGYARDGSEAGRPGYDLVVQGESGVMALNGEAGGAAPEVRGRGGGPVHRAIRGAGRAGGPVPARAHRARQGRSTSPCSIAAWR